MSAWSQSVIFAHRVSHLKHFAGWVGHWGAEEKDLIFEMQHRQLEVSVALATVIC